MNKKAEKAYWEGSLATILNNTNISKVDISKLAELIAEATLAINNKISLKYLKKTIHAHPTLAELFSEAI